MIQYAEFYKRDNQGVPYEHASAEASLIWKQETLPKEIKLKMSTDNLNRQWVSWRSCRLLELSVQGCTLLYVAWCFFGGLWLIMRPQNGWDSNFGKPFEPWNNFGFYPKNRGKAPKDFKQKSDKIWFKF